MIDYYSMIDRRPKKQAAIFIIPETASKFLGLHDGS